MSKYIDLNESNFKEITKEGISLIDFWAPWCGPCRMLAPVIEELAKEYEGKANICKVNSDEEQNLTIKYGVRSIPTMLFIKDGEVVDTLIGSQNKQAISDKLNSLI